MLSGAECLAESQSYTVGYPPSDPSTLLVLRAMPPDPAACWFQVSTGNVAGPLSRCTSTSSAATNISVFEECSQLVQLIDGCWLRLIKKFERLHHVVWRNECQRGKTSDVAANFIVGFVLRLQPNLVHFANDDSDRDGNNNEQGLYCLMKSDEDLMSRYYTEYGSGFTAINKKRPLARWLCRPVKWNPITCRSD